MEKLIVRAKQEWERTFDTVPDLIAILDPQHRIQRLNRSMSDALKIHPRDAVGKFCYELCHGTKVPPSYCPLTPMMLDGTERTVEIVEENLGGCFMLSVSPLYGEDGKVTGCVHVARDITEKKELEEELRRLASHDSLTGLPNRKHFVETLGFLLENAKRYGNPLSVAILDIDYFKEVNDQHGHQAGDDVLKRFGQIMRQALRGGDVAGRYGGDEFMIAFPHTTARGAAESVDRIRSVLEQVDFRDGARSYRVTCAAGVAELVQEERLDELIHAADMAMYEAKKKGRNRVSVHKIDFS